jgi:hypothetical protein
VHRPALLTHVFYPADRLGSGHTATRSHLHDLWTAITSAGLTEPLGGHPTRLDSTAAPPVTDTLRVLAAARQTDPGQVYTALAYQWHDAVAVTLMQAPNSAALDWRALATRWEALLPPPGEAVLLGTAAVHMGLLTTASPADAAAVAPLISAEVPDPVDSGWWHSGARTRQGFLLWDLPAPTGGTASTHRRLAVLAPSSQEAELDAWVWSSPVPGLVPFTRYLLHAAKARYERQVLLSGLPALRSLRTETDGICGSLFGKTSDWPHAAPGPSLDALTSARQDLRRLRIASGGLTTSLSSVRALAQTLEAAKANMEVAVGGDFLTPDDGPLGHDLRTAGITLAQARAEEVYLSAAHTRAGDVIAHAEAETASRLSDHQTRLALWQTSFLGALLMLLAAIQSFSYKVPLPGPLIAPSICLLSSLALALPVVTWHWSLSTAPARRARATLVASGAVGASLGWLLFSLTTHLVQRPSAPTWTVVSAAAGAVLLTTADVLRSRHIACTRSRLASS